MATSPQPTEDLSPVVIWDLLTAYQRSAALYAAIDLDVFRAIGEGPGNVPSIARQCGASERGIRILCDYLAIIGIVEKSGDTYKNTPTSAAFLDSRSPASLASTAKFIGAPEFMQPYFQLTEVVKSGRTVLPGQGSVEPEHPLWVNFARHMAPMMAPVAPALASLALAGRTGPVRVLDIAAGHGLFGIAVARQNSDARVVAQDWAPVLEVALENARSAGVESRYELLPGSAFDVNYGEPYDVVLLTNFLHHFDRETCVRLLAKIRAACKPGATVATLEFVPDENRVTPPPAAAFSLVMLATTASGDAYTFSELKEMYEEAGFGFVTAHPVPAGPQTVVLGTAA